MAEWTDLDAWVELGQKIKSAEVRSLPFTNEVISYGSPNYREIKSLVRTAIRKPSPETAATPAPDPSVVTPTTSRSTASSGLPEAIPWSSRPRAARSVWLSIQAAAAVDSR